MKGNVLLLLVLAMITACQQSTTQTENWWTPEDRSMILAELDRTTAKLQQEVDGLSPEQWRFRETPDRWSIELIVEHLEMQNQLHYRELTVTALAPQQTQYRVITEGQDQYFSKYATDPAPGTANWFLEPLGRFEGDKAWGAFARARTHLRDWVASTDRDLRKQFTFRGEGIKGQEVSGVKIGEVRDLHQLLLTGIAHTDRHLAQIKKLKAHADFPD